VVAYHICLYFYVSKLYHAHAQNIYLKLAANKRMEAVNQAKNLHLL